MISPHTLHARAQAIIAAAGGEPENWRLSLTDPTPEVRAAWAAYQALTALFHAREYLGFIRMARRWDIARFAHNYTHHKPHQRIARSCIRSAARHLAEAERVMATIEIRKLSEQRRQLRRVAA